MVKETTAHKTLYGLVLAGGTSRRMGRDKAMLSYDGTKTQLERTTELLSEVCEAVFISQREAQSFTSPKGTHPIYDSIPDIKGPLCGILSAMAAHPKTDWLVVACDMPNLSARNLQKLIRSYRELPDQFTAYQSPYDDLPEPLCAIYPFGKGAELRALAEKLGSSSPRKLLTASNARLITSDDPSSLENINTTEEFRSIIKKTQ